MSRLAETEAHIASMSGLLDIVGATRSLAGMRMQESTRMLPGIRRYAAMMAAAITDSLALMGEPQEPLRPVAERRALILCASEHGFVGAFNEHLFEAAEPVLDGQTLIVLGDRGAAKAVERGRRPDSVHPMATRSAGVPDMVNRLLRDLYERIAAGGITHVDVMFARERHGGARTIERRQLLPLDPKSLGARAQRQPPLCNLDPVTLHRNLLAEYVFAMLTEAVVESIVAENAARLAAMEAARENVSKKLENLRMEAHRQRQEEITTELLDVVTGAEAMAAGARHEAVGRRHRKSGR